MDKEKSQTIPKEKMRSRMVLYSTNHLELNLQVRLIIFGLPKLVEYFKILLSIIADHPNDWFAQFISHSTLINSIHPRPVLFHKATASSCF
jgi:hypothetical protein